MGVRRSIKMSCKSCTSYQALEVQWRIEALGDCMPVLSMRYPNGNLASHVFCQRPLSLSVRLGQTRQATDSKHTPSFSHKYKVGTKTT